MISITDKARERLLEAMKARGYDYQRLQGLYAFPWKETEDLANWWFWRV